MSVLYAALVSAYGGPGVFLGALLLEAIVASHGRCQSYYTELYQVAADPCHAKALLEFAEAFSAVSGVKRGLEEEVAPERAIATKVD